MSSSNKDKSDLIDMDEISKETKSVIDKILGDVGKASAAKQLVIGTVTGWCTGFITMKVGKAAAIAVGGGVILLQIANHKGYLKINWDKVHKLADTVEEKATGKGPKLMDKMERMIDRNLDKAEELLKNKQRKAKRWYHSFIGDDEYFQVQEIHIFLASFVVGFSIGLVSAP